MEKRKKTVKKSVSKGIVHIYSSFNNTIVSLTDLYGNVLFCGSAGLGGVFGGTKKSTPFASQIATEEVIKKAYEAGLREVHVRVKGPGIGKESAIRAVGNSGVKLLSIADVSAIPHNGCRPPKKRRV